MTPATRTVCRLAPTALGYLAEMIAAQGDQADTDLVAFQHALVELVEETSLGRIESHGGDHA